MSKPSKTWDITINNWTPEDLQLLRSWTEEVSKMCVAAEVGEQGTPHLQGRITFKRAYRFAGVAKLGIKHWHWEATKAAQDDLYCRKAGSDVLIDVNNTRPGARTDLESACALVKEKGARAVAREMPEVYVKYHKGLEALEEALEEIEPDDGFEPLPWQAEILSMLKGPADRRKILWVWETTGNVGKSRFAEHLIRDHGAYVLSGKVADMSYAYKKAPIVVFDVPREEAENMSHLYAFAEKLKNGFFFSGKFKSAMKVFRPPHVIFFSNRAPPVGAWSGDRCVEFYVGERDAFDARDV